MKGITAMESRRVGDFTDSLLTSQTTQAKSPKDTMISIIYSLILVVFGLLMIGGFFLIASQARESSWVFTVLLFVGGAAILGGILWFFTLIIRFAKPKNIVTCPSCNNRYTLYKSTRFFCCSSCLCPLFISKEQPQLLELHCPYCQHKFAANTDHGDFRCYNCGGELKIENGQIRYKNEESCSHCKSSKPTGAYICTNCNSVTATYDKFMIDSSEEAMIARGPLGLYLHLKGCLLEINDSLRKINSSERLTRYYYEEINALNKMMNILVESNLLDGKYNIKELWKVIRDIDCTYAKCLILTHDLALTDSERVHGNAYEFYVECPHVELRTKLGELFQQISAKQRVAIVDFKLQDWKKPLLSLYGKKSDLIVANIPGEVQHGHRIHNPSPLKEEALRICPELGQKGT